RTDRARAGDTSTSVSAEIEVDGAPKSNWFRSARCLGRWPGHLGPVLRSPRRSFQGDHVAVVNDPIHDRGRQGYLLHDQRPLVQSLMGGDQARPFGIAPGEHLTEGR